MNDLGKKDLKTLNTASPRMAFRIKIVDSLSGQNVLVSGAIHLPTIRSLPPTRSAQWPFHSIDLGDLCHSNLLLRCNLTFSCPILCMPSSDWVFVESEYIQNCLLTIKTVRQSPIIVIDR